jgi:hypothetical protein
MLERTLSGSVEPAQPPTNYSPIIFEKELNRNIPVVSTYTHFEQFGDIVKSDNESYPTASSRIVSGIIYKVIGTKKIGDTLIAMVVLFTETEADLVQEPFSPLIVVKVDTKARTTQKARDIYDTHLVPVSPMLASPPAIEPEIEVVVHSPVPPPRFGQVTTLPPHKLGGARKKKTTRKHKKTRNYRRSNRRRAFKRDGL